MEKTGAGKEEAGDADCMSKWEVSQAVECVEGKVRLTMSTGSPQSGDWLWGMTSREEKSHERLGRGGGLTERQKASQEYAATRKPRVSRRGVTNLVSC